MNSETDNYKRFFIKTLGCKVNQYESQAMREILTRAGFKECLAEDIADIFIINTCTVTGRADKESRRMISMFHKINPNAKIVVTGCYVEHDAAEVSFFPGVSNIIKNNDKNRIAEILGSQVQEHQPNFTISDFKNHAKAFIKVQDGCENFCAYCKVPFVRGLPRSKPIIDVLDELSSLIANGFEEVVLTGICLGAWGKDLSDNANLLDLLRELKRVPGDFRVRLSSIEPKYATDELIKFISENNWMCRHLHIPLQSGDDEILKRMNRPYTAREYAAMIGMLRSAIKDIAITTDVMIGFPGESENNFKNTLALVRDILPSRTHIFTFSKRVNTAAYGMDGNVEEPVLKRRYTQIRAAALSSSYLYRRKFMNNKLDILVETRRDKLTGLLKGYSDNYMNVLFEGSDELMKKIVPVEIDYINLNYTVGVKIS